MKNIASIVLAAGSGSRMGKTKQTLKLNEKALIRIAVENCLDSGVDQVFVILGYQHDRVASELKSLPVKLLVNDEWSYGMGNSLSFGLKALLKFQSGIDGLMIALSDQPLIEKNHFKKLYGEFIKGESPIIASGYLGTYGPPLICSKKYFQEILELKGDMGAKKIFNKYPDEIMYIPCEKAAFDIDNEEDWELLKVRFGN